MQTKSLFLLFLAGYSANNINAGNIFSYLFKSKDPAPLSDVSNALARRQKACSLQEELRIAAQCNNGQAIIHLLNTTAVNINDYYWHETVLHVTTRQIKNKALKALLGEHAQGQQLNIDARQANGKTPLHEAIENHNIQGMQLLLKAGADVNAIDRYGWTPLHYAISTPLHYTRRGDNPQEQKLHVIKELLKHGANPKIETECVIELSIPKQELTLLTFLQKRIELNKHQGRPEFNAAVIELLENKQPTLLAQCLEAVSHKLHELQDDNGLLDMSTLFEEKE